MENWNITEILKLGLPGLVFLLSMLSYNLLSNEQKKEHPKSCILNLINNFMYINVLLAVLTLVSPIIDHFFFTKSKPFDIEAKVADSKLEQGKAAVCHDAEYVNSYLLISDTSTKKLIQVFANTPIPCKENKYIVISEKDANYLGWNTGIDSKKVEVLTALRGYMFVISS